MSGSGAKFIEKELSNQGLIIIARLESAIVFSVKDKGAITDARLKQGEEERFRKIGTQLGSALKARTKIVHGLAPRKPLSCMRASMDLQRAWISSSLRSFGNKEHRLRSDKSTRCRNPVTRMLS